MMLRKTSGGRDRPMQRDRRGRPEGAGGGREAGGPPARGAGVMVDDAAEDQRRKDPDDRPGQDGEHEGDEEAPVGPGESQDPAEHRLADRLAGAPGGGAG